MLSNSSISNIKFDKKLVKTQYDDRNVRNHKWDNQKSEKIIQKL